MKTRLLTFLAAAIASAQVQPLDLDSPTPSPVTYASENATPAGGADTTISETISSSLGFGFTSISSRFLRYDLAGTTLIELPSLAIPGQSGSGIVYVGGGLDTDFIIYEVFADTGTSISPTDVATMSFGPASPNLKLSGQPVEVTFGNYATAPGAFNMTPDDLLATRSGTLLTFVPGTEIAPVTGTAPLQIDFASSNSRFVGNATRSAIGAFYIADVPGDQFLLDGITDVTVAASRTAETRLRVFGDFSATVDTMTGTYDPARVYISADACASSVLNAESLTAGEAVLVLGNATYGMIGAPSTGPDLCMEVNGISVIRETDFTARYEPVAASGFSLPEASIELGSLRKNSATATSNLILTPRDIGGVFDNQVRVTNTSDFSGDVFFRMINDLGETGPSVSLAEVIGGTSSRLVAGASTRDIDVGEIYAASIAADPTWAIASEPLRKLRLVTSGDFASIAVTLISISLDETGINTF